MLPRMPTREMPNDIKFALESPLMRTIQRVNTLVYRLSGGRLWTRWLGAPVLLLTTRGRKTGKPRTVPLIYTQDGEDLVVVASKGGWHEDPLWYRNLQADPHVEVQWGKRKRAMIAKTADATERARLWPRVIEVFKPYADYQSWTDREIPVVILRPKP